MPKRTGSILMLLTFTGILVFSGVHVSANDEPSNPSIEYMGHVINADLTVTFEYKLTSGEPPMRRWKLSSECFVKDKIVGVSEDYTLDKISHSLVFDIDYDSGETRSVYITLELSYASIILENIDYTLYWPHEDGIHWRAQTGEILGPTCPIPPEPPEPPVLIIPESPLGILGVLVTLIAATGLISALRKGIIKIEFI